jgi:hypothetical protein
MRTPVMTWILLGAALLAVVIAALFATDSSTRPISLFFLILAFHSLLCGQVQVLNRRVRELEARLRETGGERTNG